jgi:GrpB-like predicted nucleotidyltransferase (UPF0157 family)
MIDPRSELGVVRGTVRLLEFQSRWPVLFAEEKRALLTVAGRWLQDVRHVGATSVCGVAAKPIIDMVGSVRHEEDALACVDPLRGLGYEFRGEQGVSGRSFFVKGDPSTHHLHVFMPSNPAWLAMIKFREILATHPRVLEGYRRLKLALAARFPDDRRAYQDGKATFIKDVLSEYGS